MVWRKAEAQRVGLGVGGMAAEWPYQAGQVTGLKLEWSWMLQRPQRHYDGLNMKPEASWVVSQRESRDRTSKL